MVALSSTLRLELLPLGIQVALLLPYAITSRSTTSIPSQIPDYIGRHPADSDDALADFSKKTGAMLNQVFSWERLKETETALIAIREIAGRDKVEREYRVGGLLGCLVGRLFMCSLRDRQLTDVFARTPLQATILREALSRWNGTNGSSPI